MPDLSKELQSLTDWTMNVPNTGVSRRKIVSYFTPILPDAGDADQKDGDHGSNGASLSTQKAQFPQKSASSRDVRNKRKTKSQPGPKAAKNSKATPRKSSTASVRGKSAVRKLSQSGLTRSNKMSVATSTTKRKLTPGNDSGAVTAAKRIKIATVKKISNVVAEDPRKPSIAVAPPTPPADPVVLYALKPAPHGTPPVWAESRQALCETLPYYRAYQSGAYTSGGFAYGFMLGNAKTERSYFGEEVMITRVGGYHAADDAGELVQYGDVPANDAQVKSFRNNMAQKVPIVIIVGKDNEDCIVFLRHEYNVLDVFQVTDVWAEKNKARVTYKYRFEKIYLDQKSWWAPIGSALPPAEPVYPEPCPRSVCKTCDEESKEVYEQGWMCLNRDCKAFWKLGNADAPSVLNFNPAFLNERTKWPEHIKPSYSLKPDLFEVDREGESAAAFSRDGWKGMACPECGCCSSRSLWEHWKCENAACGFTHSVRQPILTARSLLDSHEVEYSGHAIPRDEYIGDVSARKTEFQGNWRIEQYDLVAGNTITHFQANKSINAEQNGPNDLFAALQKDNCMGLQRFPMTMKTGKGTVYAQHFSVNFGLPYKYVVAVKSRSFQEAPGGILTALQRMEWAGRKTVQDGSFRSFNELLAVGYFEGAKMGYHDDGEDTLGPTIATLSLGGSAEMTLRMKKRYYFGQTKSGKYDPKEPVLPGCLLEDERKALNSKFGKISDEKFAKLRDEMYAKLKRRSGNAPVVLRMHLRHGDMIVMHGPEMQKYYEHSVIPSGKLRFALTSRFIKPELIDKAQHFKGDFDASIVPKYHGDGIDASSGDIDAPADGTITRAIRVPTPDTDILMHCVNDSDNQLSSATPIAGIPDDTHGTLGAPQDDMTSSTLTTNDELSFNSLKTFDDSLITTSTTTTTTSPLYGSSKSSKIVVLHISYPIIPKAPAVIAELTLEDNLDVHEKKIDNTAADLASLNILGGASAAITEMPISSAEDPFVNATSPEDIDENLRKELGHLLP